ncbi:MAG: response regulator [Fusobacteriota bacterium]
MDKISLKNNKYIIINALISIIVFLIFVNYYRNYSLNQVTDRISEHVKVISGPIWNFEKEVANQYLQLASTSYNYEKVVVTDSYGDPFLKITNTKPSKLEFLLISMDLMPKKELSSQIFFHDVPIGNLKIVWRSKNIFVYFYGFIVVFLICMVSILITGLIKMNSNLEKEVQKRTEALTKSNKLLKKSEKNARNANNAKSQFLANMSHELRTPMNGIIGMTELISMTNLNHEQKNYIKSIEISADRLLNIINDILDISKIEAGKIELYEQKFCLEDLISEVFSVVSYKAHKKKLELINFIDPSIPKFLSGDEGKLRQILINLVSNSVKFTNSGSIIIEVKNNTESNKKLELSFIVKDTGIGITEEIQKKLFKPFEQGDQSYTKQYQGTGLGLSIVKRFIDLMGGDISIDSEIGKGTSIKFRLVFKKVEGMNNEKIHLENNLKDLSLLFIDDNAMNRTILKKMLEKEGIDVTLAKSGKEGINILEKNKNIKIVLLDVHMPEEDGISVAKKIKKLYDDKYTILLFSSVDLGKNIDNIMGITDGDYLMKPVKRHDLIEKLNKVLNKSKDKFEEKEKPHVNTNKNSEKTILIVEDDEVNRNTLINMLDSIGDYNIRVAIDGSEAVKSYKKYSPDIIFMDLQLPKKDGLTAYKEIREISNDKDFKVIALTAYARDEDRQKCLDAGMDKFVSKPFRRSDLLEALENK